MEFCSIGRSNGSSIIIFRHLYQKFRYRFKSNFQKFTWYTKLKIRKHLYRQAPHTQKQFCRKDDYDLRYCFAINSFFVPITLELKTTFFKINPTLLCASSTKFLVFIGDHLLFLNHFSLSQKCSLKCVVFQELFRLFFFQDLYI